MKEENRVLTEAWDGSPMWVPESRLEEYRKAQDELKKTNGQSEAAKALGEKIFRKLTESRAKK